MSKKLWVILFVAVMLLLLSYFFAEHAPPRASTEGRLDLTELRIRQYAAKHYRLPASLSDLPQLEGNRDSSSVDGWGRPIQYTVEGQTVTLRSLGKDGRPGGVGQDADIEVRFTILATSSRAASQE